MSEKLAIHGGTRAVPENIIRKWPPINDLDRKMVLASLEGTTHAYGYNYKELEKEFAAWSGLRHALYCNSGTAALHMAIVACQIGCGDEVIVPAYTWPSSATCCLHHNAIPVFVDIEWSTMNIDASRIEAAITSRTKAIIAVHLHGLSADMDAISNIAKKHNLRIIEDCCQAHGVTHRGRKAGTIGHVAAFSCNHNKCLSSGEGGFFVSDDPEIFERGKTLWYFGEHRRPESGTSHQSYGMGWMYRSTDLDAAFTRAQLTRLDENLAVLKENAERMHKCLEGTPNLIRPVIPPGHGHNWYNYTMRFDMDAMGHGDDAARFRDKIVKAMCAEGVETGVWQGWPVPEMTAIAAKNAYGRGCPWACTDSKVNYSLDQFPMAVKHCAWHTGMTFPLRNPNDKKVAEFMAAGIRKVLVNLDQVEKIA